MAAEAAPLPLPAQCFHCGLDVPRGVEIHARVLGELQPMCCVGCCAVAEMLDSSGLAEWYRYREGPTGARSEPVPDVLKRSDYLDLEEIERKFVSSPQEGLVEASLLVAGVTCAACVWVIERHLENLDGVASARVNLLSHRATVAWNPAQCSLRDIVRALAEIGFTARPDRPDVATALEGEERRAALIRLGIAGLGTMNVMTYAVALYLGVIDDMTPAAQQFLRWMCLLVATPVVFISARPFFVAAVRDLRARRPGMDVPVALAIGGAYLVSSWAVVRGGGEVYFDSACMFTFFLGLGRYLEMSVRHRARARSRSLLEDMPLVAHLQLAGGERAVAAESLTVGDRFIVRPGETIAADGTVVEGISSVEEALLTGEPWPVAVRPKSAVIAGSVNIDSPLVVQATRTGAETRLGTMAAWIERAGSEKPPIARTADRVATIFVSVVLLIAAATALYWGLTSPDRAIWVTLSVLVATCPCALSLATPAALAASTHGLAQIGLFVTRAHVIETLARASRLVFDKTGTLTMGEPSLVEIVPLRDDSRARWIAIARALESRSEHVLARAFDSSTLAVADEDVMRATDVVSKVGAGVEGRVDGKRFRLGSPEWASEIAEPLERSPEGVAAGPREEPPKPPSKNSHSWVLLADEEGACAWFGIDDPLRKEAGSAVEKLGRQGLALEMLSGDPSEARTRVAESLGLGLDAAPSTPDEKVAYIQRLQARGDIVITVGDGVNDGPVSRAADVSVAMGSACDLTRTAADAVLANDDLSRLPLAIQLARDTRRVIQQNFAWAIAYNLCVLPLAVSGNLAPWLAAAGMSLSSLVVVLNATRLARVRLER